MTEPTDEEIEKFIDDANEIGEKMQEDLQTSAFKHIFGSNLMQGQQCYIWQMLASVCVTYCIAIIKSNEKTEKLQAEVISQLMQHIINKSADMLPYMQINNISKDN